jgi:PAS domain-containing protein
VAAYLGLSPTWLSWSVFATGLLLAALLASYIAYYLGIEAALHESEERSRRQLLELETLYRTAPIGLAFVDRDLRFLHINEKLAEIDGVPMDAHIGHTLREVVPGVADTIEPLYRRVIETGEPVLHIEIHGITPAQPIIERDWLADYYPLKGPDGSVQAVGAIVVEITERRRAEIALRRSKEFLDHVLDAIDDDVFVKDERHAWVVLNKSACELIGGGSREELIGKSEVLGAVLVFHDVSETRRMARQLQHDAAHDALTGLINRREFEGRLERAVASAKRYGFHHALVTSTSINSSLLTIPPVTPPGTRF